MRFFCFVRCFSFLLPFAVHQKSSETFYQIKVNNNRIPKRWRKERATWASQKEEKIKWKWAAYNQLCWMLYVVAVDLISVVVRIIVWTIKTNIVTRLVCAVFSVRHLVFGVFSKSCGALWAVEERSSMPVIFRFFFLFWDCWIISVSFST